MEIIFWSSPFFPPCLAAFLSFGGKNIQTPDTETSAIKSNMAFHFLGAQFAQNKQNANTIWCRVMALLLARRHLSEYLGHSLIDRYDLKMASNEHLKSVKLDKV